MKHAALKKNNFVIFPSPLSSEFEGDDRLPRNSEPGTLRCRANSLKRRF